MASVAVAGLTWLSVHVRSTEGQGGEGETESDLAGREAYRRMQLEDEDGKIPPNAWADAQKEKDEMPFLPEAWSEFTAYGAEGPNPWVSIGPGNIGGRIRSILIHPRAPDTMWVGGVSGGVWKTTNGGLTSWSTNTDLMENLAVTCMAMDSTGTDITLYAGTGEGFTNGDAVQGNGIFKSTDAGAHWAQLPSTANNVHFQHVNRLAVCPTNPQILLAATDFGIFRSTDGGDNWSQSTGYDNHYSWVDVRFRPSSDGPGEQPSFIDCLAATIHGDLFYSMDNGATWDTNAGNGLPSPSTLRRIELAYSRSNPWVVYASTGPGGNDPSLLFYSEDYGYSFKSLGHPQDPTNPNLGGANWYANVLWVDPTDPDTVVVGGAYMLRTRDRGAHWEEADSGSHVDQHVIVEHPGYTGASGGNKVAFCATDGGIHRTENILAAATPTPPPGGSVTWTSLNNALGVTQFYGGAANAITGKIIGGTQDNGTVRYEGDAEDWHILEGALTGDGGFCAADQVGESELPYYYGEAPKLQIYRSIDNAISKHYIIDGPHGIPRSCQGAVPCAVFAAPFVLDPNNRARILAGGRSLWRTNNARAEDALDVCWAEIKQQLADISPITAIAVATGNSDLIWVGHLDGSVFYTTNGTLGAACPSPSPTPSWTSGDPGNVLPHFRMCTRITIAPVQPTNDPQAQRPVYATFGGFTQSSVWKRDSNGAWSNIHNNLPKLPVFSLVISPANPNFLYIGTELGVFASFDDGAHWSPANGGPANTQVVELFWLGPKLVAVTHGRGMFVLPPPTQINPP